MTVRLALTRAAIAATATTAALAVLPTSQVAAAVPAKSDRGSLRVVAEGVPQGGRAKITVARKDWRKKVPTAGTLKNLKPGTYRVWATPIVADGGTAYVPNLPVRVKVPRRKSATLSLRYQWNPKNDVYPPGPVSGLQVTSATATGVSLRWVNGQAPDLQGIAVRRKQGTVAPVALDDGKVVQVSETGSSATDSDIQQLTTYSYSVFMVDLAGNASAPVSTTVTTKGQAVDLAAGLQHTCALLGSAGVANGQVACWGNNSRGQLGDGTTDARAVPDLTALGNVAQVVAGADHTCARVKDGSVWCWGKNDRGQLGDGTTQDSALPVRVNLPAGSPSALIEAAGDHTCAVSTTGLLRCWGANESGQSGQRPSTSVVTPPVTAVAQSVSAVALGWSHTCYIRSGQPRCFGANGAGQLGNGTTTDSVQGVPVGGLSRVTQLAAGVEHTCAVLPDRSLQCWGANTYGQLGDGTTTDRDTPTDVTGVFQEAAAGAYHTCAVTESQQVRCWGRNGAGRLGDGTATDRTVPTRVQLPAAASHVRTGTYHSCAVLPADTYCWGANHLGQLGTPIFSGSLTPVLVTDL